jgi:hypothetical protein
MAMQPGSGRKSVPGGGGRPTTKPTKPKPLSKGGSRRRSVPRSVRKRSGGY